MRRKKKDLVAIAAGRYEQLAYDMGYAQGELTEFLQTMLDRIEQLELEVEMLKAGPDHGLKLLVTHDDSDGRWFEVQDETRQYKAIGRMP